MKKLIASLTAIASIVSFSAINVYPSESIPITFVDGEEGDVYLSLDEDTEIEDYCSIKVLKFDTTDIIYCHEAGYSPDYYGDLINSLGGSRKGYQSGEDAELAVLYVDITNLDTKAKDFLKKCKVNLKYEDKYDYEGFSLQYNPSVVNAFFKEPANEVSIHPDDNFPIDPLYTGHYGFVCKVPNMVVEHVGDKNTEIKLEINIDDHNLIYYVNE